MFKKIKRKKIERIGLEDRTNISKVLFGIGLFVLIALIWIFYFVFTQYFGNSNVSLSGTIIYQERGLGDVLVSVGESNVVTDEKGSFIIKNIRYGRQTIKIEKEGFASKEEKRFFWKKNIDLGKINLEKKGNLKTGFSGNIFDSFTKKAVPGAIVEFGKSSMTTDNNGSFSFPNIEKGEAVIKITAIGYGDYIETISLENTDNFTKDFYISPEGRVVFTSSREGKKNIYSVSYDGKNERNYTASIKGDCWSGRFTGDGSKLVFYSNSGDDLDEWGQKITNLYFLNKDSKEPKKINKELIVEDEYKLSINRNRVIFLGKNKESTKEELYIVGLNNNPEWIQLTDNDIKESNFDISPDGNYAVFAAFENNERKIFIVDIAKKEIKPILNSQNRETIIAFNPDSKSLVYTMEGYDFETRIFKYDILSGKTKEVYKNIAGISDLIFNSTGDKMAMILSRDDRSYIYVINSDGTNETKILEKSGNYENLVWPRIEKILVVKSQEGDGKVVSILDLTQRKINKIEDIYNDIISWQGE